jgi:hypothetical protein
MSLSPWQTVDSTGSGTLQHVSKTQQDQDSICTVRIHTR